MFKFAENLLNNLDQTAQSTVQTARDQTVKTKNTTKHSKTKSTANLTSYSDVNSPGPRSISATSSSVNLTNINTGKKSKKQKDEDLFENFLNSTEKLEVNTLKNTSTVSLDKNEDSPDNVEFAVGGNQSSKTSDNGDSENQSLEINENEIPDDSANTNNNDEEKEMIKNEMISMQDEIKSLEKQIKSSQIDYQRARKKLENYQQQISESDKIVRELRSREEDLTETVKGKDSQLAVLRVRFTENESELMQKRSEIEALRSESERLLKDHSNSSDIQSQAFETLKDKVKDLEHSLEKEKESLAEFQKEFLSMQNKLESEKQNLNETIQTIEKKLNDEKIKNTGLNNQIKSAQSKLKSSSLNLKQELDEYKLKATKTLAAKDRIITQLKEKKTGNSAEDDSESTPLKFIEIEELKGERDYLKDELDSKVSSIEMLRAEIAEIESQTAIEVETLKDQHRCLIEEQDECKQAKDYLDQDLKSLREQLAYAQEELYKQKSASSNRFNEREVEIEKLRNQLTTKNLGSTTEKELENRLHLLTENLIQKQTLIEALQSEKHSIFLQLERSEKRLHDYETIVSSKNNSTSIRLGGDDDDGPGHKNVFRESPYDHEVTKKVKRAATEIDKFSIRLGVFLKKYPIARIFVLFYMFLLHLWVVVVLFTYTPEAHDASYGVSGMPHHPNS